MIRHTPSGSSGRRAARGRGAESIEVAIEALELDGLPAADPLRVRRAFEAELVRLLREEGVPELTGRQPASDAWIEAGELAAAELESPERLGESLAQRVYAELAR